MFRGESVRYVYDTSAALTTRPPIVFLHSGGTSHRIWDAQLSHFSASHRVYALDLLGYGTSTKPDVDYALPLYSEMLGAFLDACQIPSAVLVGNCLGSATSLHYALSHPTRVSALVLSNVLTEKTLLRGTFGPLYRLKSIHRAVDTSLMRLARSLVLPSWSRGISARSLFGRSGARPGWLVDHLACELADRAQLRVLYSLLRNVGTFSVLDRASMPRDFPFVCTVWGRDNRVLRVEGGQQFCDAFRPDRAVVFDGCGHLPMCEAPERFNAILEDALARAEARSGPRRPHA